MEKRYTRTVGGRQGQRCGTRSNWVERLPQRRGKQVRWTQPTAATEGLAIGETNQKLLGLLLGHLDNPIRTRLADLWLVMARASHFEAQGREGS